MLSFSQFLSETKTIPMGDCFRFATKKAVEMLADDVIPENTIFVVHAMVSTKWHPKPYTHAWVEAMGRVYDWQMSNTIGSLSVKDFYKLYHPTNIRKYKPGEAVGNGARSGHHGPW